MFRLFEAFFLSARYRLHRDDILEQVYDLVDIANVSSRMRVSYNQNIVKLLSRARETIQSSLKRSVYSWVVYDSLTEEWDLFADRPRQLHS